MGVALAPKRIALPVCAPDAECPCSPSRGYHARALLPAFSVHRVPLRTVRVVMARPPTGCSALIAIDPFPKAIYARKLALVLQLFQGVGAWVYEILRPVIFTVGHFPGTCGLEVEFEPVVWPMVFDVDVLYFSCLFPPHGFWCFHDPSETRMLTLILRCGCGNRSSVARCRVLRIPGPVRADGGHVPAEVDALRGRWCECAPLQEHLFREVLCVYCEKVPGNGG